MKELSCYKWTRIFEAIWGWTLWVGVLYGVIYSISYLAIKQDNYILTDYYKFIVNIGIVLLYYIGILYLMTLIFTIVIKCQRKKDDKYKTMQPQYHRILFSSPNSEAARIVCQDKVEHRISTVNCEQYHDYASDAISIPLHNITSLLKILMGKII
jgi:hypothetical protein